MPTTSISVAQPTPLVAETDVAFLATVEDAEDDPVNLLIDWDGDNVVDETISAIVPSSDGNFVVEHQFEEEGTVCIKVCRNVCVACGL